MIKVGCCGFAKGKSIYFRTFKLVEIQQTFYRLPKLGTVRKWREESPPDFEFSVKAFQGISHPVKSPTWRRSNVVLTGREKYGNLQPSEDVFKAWERTLEICDELRAKVCLIQLPKSFRDTPINIENAKQFFSSIEKGKLDIAIELRGWHDINIKRLCEEFDLIDCRDPFASMPAYVNKKGIAYLRLHGSPPGTRMYRYSYTDADLLKLKEKIENLNAKCTYVLFNNVTMFDDAERFKKII